MKPGRTGIARILKAFGYSYDGFAAVFKNEAAFRQELFLCIVLFPIPFFLPTTAVEKALLIAPLFVILLMELVNSAIEAVIDRISADIHPLSKTAKDIGSLLVLIAFFFLFSIWSLILPGLVSTYFN